MDTEGCTAAIMSVLNVQRPKYGPAVGEQLNKEHDTGCPNPFLVDRSQDFYPPR